MKGSSGPSGGGAFTHLVRSIAFFVHSSIQYIVVTTCREEFGVLRLKSRCPSDDLLMVMLETFGVSQAELSEDGRTLVAWS